tara:strand:- start:300 stop:473 length:174 start_codon:yes stop_codon:yes gene_type:complete
MKSENEIEVRVSSHQNLNDVFQEFSKQGIEISSMRAKSNRLEELFISYVDAKRNDDE